MNQSVSIDQAVQMAISHYQSGQIAEAESICKQVLDVEPKSLDTLHLMGVISSQTGRHKNAVKFIRQAIKIKDDIPALYSNLGIAYQSQNMFDEALEAYGKAIALKPDFADVLMNMGNIFKAQEDFDAAIEHYRKAIAANPSNPLVYYNLGNALQTQAVDAAAAMAAYENAIALHADFAEAHANLGTLYKEQGRPDEAAERYRKAIALKPNFVEAHYNLGILLDEQGLRDDAAVLYRQAVAIDPSNAKAQNNLGLSLSDQGNGDEAEARYRQAIELDPDNADAYYNLGIALRGQGKLGEALEAYEQAIERAPEEALFLNEFVHQLQHACAWEEAVPHEKTLLEMVRAEREGISPFAVLNLQSATPDDHLLSARTFSKKQEVPVKSMFSHQPQKKEGKLRIGYLSCDFHDHATAHLMAELFERHDRSRFETTAYSYGVDDGSTMRKRLESAFTHFVDIRKLSHAASAKKINGDGIDILIDLKGYTAGARMHIPAYRPAPVQVNFLGYPGTMGASYIDYIIADDFIIPEGQQQFYSEKVIRLQGCYQPNDTHRKISDIAPTRAACGLPEQGFVFCCFNQTYKITSDVFDIWMRLLQNVSGSVLWLLECNTLVKANLQKQAKARGIDLSRLVFAPRMPSAAHLARHRLADLFLDTLPVNAHTTASDALWAGLPVITCSGDTFASRVAGSLLTAAGLPELVTLSLKDYETLALSYAQSPEKISALRLKMEQTRLQMPLFDITQFTKNIEGAYQAMWDDWQKK